MYTRAEKILQALNERGRVAEDEFHAMQLRSPAVSGLTFKDVMWYCVDNKYRTPLPYGPFSHELHETIEAAIESGQRKRNPDNPLILEYADQAQ